MSKRSGISAPLMEIQLALRADFPIEHDIQAPPRRTHGLVLFQSGTTDYYYDGVRFHAGPDSVVLLPRGRVYRIERTTPTSLIYINFLTTEDVGQHCHRLQPFSFTPGNSALLRELAARICAQYALRPAGFEKRMLGLFYELLSELEADSEDAKGGRDVTSFEASLRFLETKLTDSSLRIETLAAIAGVSTRYYDTLFRRRFGESPKAYILRRRIEHAKSRLAGSRDTIAEIALQCGFSDAYHLGRTFKQQCGISPGEYRRYMMV